ncbi:MAG: hypothetical protein HN757_08680, partial [Calditrichaeota bacterium]|nr:hypothetical protein [Calditrichota bacterium]
MGGMILGSKFLSIVLLLAIIVVPCSGISGEVQQEEPSDSGLQTVVSIDAEDAYLPSVLSILAAKSGYNIVTGPGVSKEERISIHLSDTPIEEAMNLVVRAAGLSYDVVGKSFLIAKADKLGRQVGESSYVIDLQYAVAADVMNLLNDFQASIQVDMSGNKLLVLTTPKIISDIRDVIEAIDVPALQITLSARLI